MDQTMSGYLVPVDVCNYTSGPIFDEERLLQVDEAGIFSIPRIWNTCHKGKEAQQLATTVMVERGILRLEAGDKVLIQWVDDEGGKIDKINLTVQSSGPTEGVILKSWKWMGRSKHPAAFIDGEPIGQKWVLTEEGLRPLIEASATTSTVVPTQTSQLQGAGPIPPPSILGALEAARKDAQNTD